jgi:hypothetical protein
MDSSSDSEPASADTMNAALDAVQALYPPESTMLADLQLESFDDDSAFIVAIVGGTGEGSYDHEPIDECISEQFNAFGIPQTPYVSVRALAICLLDDDSSDDGDSSDDAPSSS